MDVKQLTTVSQNHIEQNRFDILIDFIFATILVADPFRFAADPSCDPIRLERIKDMGVESNVYLSIRRSLSFNSI